MIVYEIWQAILKYGSWDWVSKNKITDRLEAAKKSEDSATITE
jgi:hypothetical protein